MAVAGGWLYVADPGHGRVVRLDVAGGHAAGDVKPRRFWREPYAGGYTAWANATVRASPGRLSDLSVSLCKSVFYGAFVWARRAFNRSKRRFPARAGRGGRAPRARRGWALAITSYHWS